ncbi:hypothetical protein ZOSMA_390G00060 [Zostera marina]|uniref:TF-B3 domain-containing protein n=1 Tax=Zostera marina TaxID=29655 RepID=A0A0K9P6M3_ZOSMR|nr:hypothetical protein ZOSMA_390G00060 [Zostera marina]
MEGGELCRYNNGSSKFYFPEDPRDVEGRMRIRRRKRRMRMMGNGGFSKTVVGFPGGGRGKRSVRQRRLFVQPFKCFVSAIPPAPLVSSGVPPLPPPPIRRGFPFPGKTWSGVRFVLQKELRNSDVGSLGRMVLPKKEAELYLPGLTAREGIMINMDDMSTLQEWTFKYRFWPNNRSRMYVLENTGEFVKIHGLQVGDFIMVYRDDCRDRYIIRARKAKSTKEVEVAEEEEEEEVAPLPQVDDLFVAQVTQTTTDLSGTNYTDLYLPLSDEMSSISFNMTDADSTAFSTDFAFCFDNDIMGNNHPRVLESVPSLDSIDNLSLDDF